MKKPLVVCAAIVLIGMVAFFGRSAYRNWQIRSEIEKLSVSDSEVRRKAAWKLGKMGPAARAAVPALIETLMREVSEEPRHSAKAAAADALVDVGPSAIPLLLEALRDKDSRDRGWGIAPPETYETSMPQLFRALRDMRSREDPESKDVEAALRELMNHDCRHVRLWAGQALGDFELESGKPITYPPQTGEGTPIEYWVANLKHEHGYVRAWAAHILGENASHTALTAKEALLKDALPALVEGLGDSDDAVRLNTADALRSITRHARGEAKEVVPALIQAIPAVDGYPFPSNLYLFQSLSNVGSEATAAIPALSEILGNKQHDTYNRTVAANTLGAIGHTDSIPALLKALDDPEAQICGAAANALGRIGSSAREAIPKLIKLLDDERIHAGTTSYSVSAERIESKGISVRETAAEALRRIDQDAAAKAGVP